MAEFRHFDLSIFDPPFKSHLTDLVIDLNHLRQKKLEGTTHSALFFQIKSIFQMLESIGSARIEGNNTTLLEYIEKKADQQEDAQENTQEIHNIEKALAFIDDLVEEHPINRAFVSELHKRVVVGLNQEGDKTPGAYRIHSVKIAKSQHRPPEPHLIVDYMDELFAFIAENSSAKYDLLKVAQAHHRFVWIHPFGNGNGRTVRLLTYAMLIKYGFNVKQGRILNPTAVFCNNRQLYYDYLSQADQGNIMPWCEYVLDGIKGEIEKIDRLLDYPYLQDKILLPALLDARQQEIITDLEQKILNIAVEKQTIQASDLKRLFQGKAPHDISRRIAILKDKNLLQALEEGKRTYLPCFINNRLMRSMMRVLDRQGFLPFRNE